MDGWIRRGELAATASAVNPGTQDGAWLRWERAQIQDWSWRRVRHHTGGAIELAVDLGCGFGDWAQRLSTIARRIVAVDVSPGFVDQTRSRLAGHPAADVRCADIRTFGDFDEASLVHLGAVLMYVDDEEVATVLRRVRDRLAPDGLVHTRDWCAINLGRPSRQHANGLDSVHRSPAQYVQLARAAGLRLVELRRASSIYGEQLAYRSVGLRRERLTRITRWIPSLVFRIATAYRTRGSVSYLFRRA